MGLPREEAAEAARVAVLRDVGKAVVDDDDRVLGKPGPLDDVEWELVRMLPVVGGGSSPRRKGSPTSRRP